MNEIYEIVGVIHVHSTYSDGTWDIDRIARTADEVGLDFILFSDHFTLKPKKDGVEGLYGNTLALAGYETSDFRDRNHYLIFQLDDVVPGIYAEEYVMETARRNGIGIIAHPMEKRDSLEDYPPYPWTAWEADRYIGIEIWNQLSEWMEGLTSKNKIFRFIHPLKTTVAPPTELLEKWDDAAQSRRVVGIAGIDAHSFIVKFLKLFKVRIFHYKVTFKSLRNHILLPQPFPRSEFKRAESLIYEGIREARLFFSNARFGDARGFRFNAVSEGQSVTMGGALKGPAAVFEVESPLDCEISLIHNGNRVASSASRHLEYRTSTPGVYRVEAKRRGRVWVFTNHIYYNLPIE